ncbi:hypothetical protein ACEQPO_08095 [Bacillus sp. SL00103]
MQLFNLFGATEVLLLERLISSWALLKSSQAYSQATSVRCGGRCKSNYSFGAISFIWNGLQLLFIGRIVKGIMGLVKSVGGLVAGMWNSVKSSC